MTAKDVGIRIRVERELRDAFQQACAAENRGASDLLREFMRSFADHQVNGLQIGLFGVQEPRAQYAPSSSSGWHGGRDAKRPKAGGARNAKR